MLTQKVYQPEKYFDTKKNPIKINVFGDQWNQFNLPVLPVKTYKDKNDFFTKLQILEWKLFFQAMVPAQHKLFAVAHTPGTAGMPSQWLMENLKVSLNVLVQ